MCIKAKVMNAGKETEVTITQRRRLPRTHLCYLVHFDDGDTHWMPEETVILDEQGKKDIHFVPWWRGK